MIKIKPKRVAQGCGAAQGGKLAVYTTKIVNTGSYPYHGVVSAAFVRVAQGSRRKMCNAHTYLSGRRADRRTAVRRKLRKFLATRLQLRKFVFFRHFLAVLCVDDCLHATEK